MFGSTIYSTGGRPRLAAPDATVGEPGSRTVHAAGSAASAAWAARADRGARTQGAPRRHPHGRAAAAGRGAAQRLPDHAGGQERSDGMWSPSPGSVYPALQQLEDEGLIRARESDGRKLFALTDAGREYVAGARRGAAGAVGADERAMSQRRGARARSADARGRVRLRAGGEDRQRGADGEAREVLTTTRKDLYRILADGDRRRRGRCTRHRSVRRAGLSASRYRGTTRAMPQHPQSSDHRTPLERRAPARRAGDARAVAVQGLVKRYGELEAVRGIDFEVARRGDVRLPRPERGGQVDDDQHAVHAGAPERRLGAGGRPRRRAANATRCGATSGWCSRTRRSTAI